MTGGGDTALITAMAGVIVSLATFITVMFKLALEQSNARVVMLQERETVTNVAVVDSVKSMVATLSAISATLTAFQTDHERHANQTNELLITLKARQDWERGRLP